MGSDGQLISGRVVRYEASRGYGFIAPDDGGKDVFVHATELDATGVAIACGMRVRFRMVEGIKGAKAYDVSAITETPTTPPAPMRPLASAPVRPVPEPSTVEVDDTCEVVPESQFTQEVTELILQAAPALTGADLVAIREDFRDYAVKHGWVD